MSAAIVKIDRQLDNLKQFSINEIQSYKDNSISAIEHKIDNLLRDIFGRNTFQYDKYKYISDF